jgi:hypothetical protein
VSIVFKIAVKNPRFIMFVVWRRKMSGENRKKRMKAFIELRLPVRFFPFQIYVSDQHVPQPCANLNQETPGDMPHIERNILYLSKF